MYLNNSIINNKFIKIVKFLHTEIKLNRARIHHRITIELIHQKRRIKNILVKKIINSDLTKLNKLFKTSHLKMVICLFNKNSCKITKVSLLYMRKNHKSHIIIYSIIFRNTMMKALPLYLKI